MFTTKTKYSCPNNAFSGVRNFVQESLEYEFTPSETKVLNAFFTNLDKRVSFIKILSGNVVATILSMFSRMKNPRGVRGTFVDSYLPMVLAVHLHEFKERLAEEGSSYNEEKFLREKEIKCLDAFINYSEESNAVWGSFSGNLSDFSTPFDFMADSKKSNRFLKIWLDKYGHNSIARMGSISFLCEEVSILAAKSLEWTRPGAGYVELSTRYVDMSAKGLFPTSQFLNDGWGVESSEIENLFNKCFRGYADLFGDGETGPFPDFLRNEYAKVINSERDLNIGVFGESCDVLGNLLPASSLVSLGITVSGEAFQSLLRHLLLDDLPETICLAELIFEESEKVGANQFARHFEPTEWDRSLWSCKNDLSDLRPECRTGSNYLKKIHIPDSDYIERTLSDLMGFNDMVGLLYYLKNLKRLEYDKLPREFESVSLSSVAIMSYRGWRDLHRMGFCWHKRNLLTTEWGFYEYDKPHPSELTDIFNNIGGLSVLLHKKCVNLGIPLEVLQYILPIGFRVPFQIGANLRQFEFCNWQRGKFSVNHEVRQVFLEIEECISNNLYWWREVSRCDTTPAYIFARGSKGVPFS